MVISGIDNQNTIIDANGYLDAVSDIVRQAKSVAARSVNLAMVYAYFEVGRIIVEEEQAGSDRAAYGKQVLAQVSIRLTMEFGRGFSKTNVKQMRQFYRVYATDQIGQTLPDQFTNLPAASTGRIIKLCCLARRN